MAAILGFLVVVFVVIPVISSVLSAGTQAASKGVAAVRYGGLAVAVSEGSLTHSDLTMPAVTIKVKGVIPGHLSGSVLFFHLFDRATGEPIVCLIDSLQDRATRFFEFAPPDVISDGSAFTDWAEVLSIPKLSLIAPHKGMRVIQCRLSILPAEPQALFVAGKQLAGSSPLRVEVAEFTFEQAEAGYIDRAESAKEAQRGTIQLAVMMAAVDGKIADKELVPVHSWIKKIAESDNDSEKQRRAKLLNGYLQDAIRSHNSLSLESVLASLRAGFSEAERYEAIDLCTNILSADGVMAKEERALLDMAITKLGLDPQIARAVLDKTIAKGKLDLGGSDEDYSDLGIRVGMSKEEIRKVLLDEYRRWNARTAHHDPTVRERAAHLVQRIALARAKLLG